MCLYWLNEWYCISKHYIKHISNRSKYVMIMPMDMFDMFSCTLYFWTVFLDCIFGLYICTSYRLRVLFRWTISIFCIFCKTHILNMLHSQKFQPNWQYIKTVSVTKTMCHKRNIHYKIIIFSDQALYNAILYILHLTWYQTWFP